MRSGGQHGRVLVRASSWTADYVLIWPFLADACGRTAGSLVSLLVRAAPHQEGPFS